MAVSKITGKLRTSAIYSAFTFVRDGDVVTVSARPNARLNPTTGFSTVATIAEEYRPKMQITAPITWTGYANVTGLLRIETNGDLKIYASAAQKSVEVWCQFAYFVI